MNFLSVIIDLIIKMPQLIEFDEIIMSSFFSSFPIMLFLLCFTYFNVIFCKTKCCVSKNKKDFFEQNVNLFQL